MSSAKVVSAISFLAGCAGSVLLWKFWTPRCNEACPEWVSLSMIGFIAALPILCAGTGAAMSARSYPNWVKVVLFAIFAAIVVSSVVVLTSSTP